MGKYFKDENRKYFKESNSSVRMAQGSLLLNLAERFPQILKYLGSGFKNISKLPEVVPEIITAIERNADDIVKGFRSQGQNLEKLVTDAESMVAKYRPGSSTHDPIELAKWQSELATRQNNLDKFRKTVNSELGRAVNEFNIKDQANLGKITFKPFGPDQSFSDPLKLNQNIGKALTGDMVDVKGLEKLRSRLEPAEGFLDTLKKGRMPIIDRLLGSLKQDAQIQSYMSKTFEFKDFTKLKANGKPATVTHSLEDIIKNPRILDDLQVKRSDAAKLRSTYGDFLQRAEFLEKNVMRYNPFARATVKILGVGAAGAATGKIFGIPKAAEGINIYRDPEAQKESVRRQQQDIEDVFGPQYGSSGTASQNFQQPAQINTQRDSQIMERLKEAQESGNELLANFWRNQLSNPSMAGPSNFGQRPGFNNAQSPGLSYPKMPSNEQSALRQLEELRSKLVR